MLSALKKAFQSLSLQDFFVIFSLFTLTAIQMEGFCNDPGVGWHIKTGEFIFKNRTIPHFDPFLYTDLPRSWICDQWLSDLIIYLLMHWGSWPLAYATLSVIFLLTFNLILYHATASTTKQYLLASLISFYAFKIATIHFIFRPVIFSFPLFAIVFMLCYQLNILLKSSSNQELLEKKLRQCAVFFALIFLLWANLHPSFGMGLIMVLLLPIAFALNHIFFGR